jgi:molybdate transport system substrate-binding protein
MYKTFFKLFGLFVILIFGMGCSAEQTDLRIATAANMQFAMAELIDAFEQETGISAEMIMSSSGKLTAQIEAGAPFDLFFSADVKYPQELELRGLSNRPSIYAYGQLVEWQKADSEAQLFAIANPRTAPYGKATEEYIAATARTLPDVVYGESVSQVNQFLLSGTVDGGFTSLSSVLSAKFDQEGSWEIIPDSLHSPIAQAFVTVNSSEMKDEAAAFATFLSSDKAKGILEAFGYRVN